MKHNAVFLMISPPIGMTASTQNKVAPEESPVKLRLGLPGPQSTLYFRSSWDCPWQPGVESSLGFDGPVVPLAPPNIELEER
jgi:hypothetical protein